MTGYINHILRDRDGWRFLTFDDYDTSAPIAMHKYLYANGNPVMGIDPTGRFTLIELAVNTAISTLVGYVIRPIIQPAIKHIANALVPPALYNAIAVSSLDSFMVGVDAGVSLKVGGVLGLQLFSAGGGEALVNFKGQGISLYTYYTIWSASLGKDTQAALPKPGLFSAGVSLGVKAGLVFNAPTPEAYEGAFMSVTLSSRWIPESFKKVISSGIAKALTAADLVVVSPLEPPAVGLFDHVLREARRKELWSNLARTIVDRFSISLFWTPGSLTNGAKGFSFNIALTGGDADHVSLTRTEYSLFA